MTRSARHALTIDVVVDSARWNNDPSARAAARRAVTQAAAMRSTRPAELAIVLSDDSAIRSLNRLWRGIDAATNVLSFPSSAARGEPAHLGDIVLAYETIAREARADHKPMAHHVAHLAVHGYLHLIGYDHERTADAETMEQNEREILQQLSIPDPYLTPPPPRRARRSATKRPAQSGAKARTLPRIPA
jgi:probable rRNA maturation factor